MKQRLVLATRNKGKIEEISRLLADLPFEVVGIESFQPPFYPEETGDSFRENAALKATFAAQFTGEMAMADDSGLEVDVLGGRPGVYSARYAGTGATDDDNNRKLLEEMKGIPWARRTARFCCVVAIATSPGSVFFAEGFLSGYITLQPRGEGGFGYDPLFFLPEAGKTLAEMSTDEKNRVSHRGRALRAARKILLERCKDAVGGNQ